MGPLQIALSKILLHNFHLQNGDDICMDAAGTEILDT